MSEKNNYFFGEDTHRIEPKWLNNLVADTFVILFFGCPIAVVASWF